MSCYCQKAQYTTKDAARRAQGNAIRRDHEPMRVYPCPFQSRTWHITSLAPRGPRRTQQMRGEDRWDVPSEKLRRIAEAPEPEIRPMTEAEKRTITQGGQPLRRADE